MDSRTGFDLTTKSGLMAYLGTLPPQVIVDFLAQGDRDRLLEELAAFGHQAQSQNAPLAVATSLEVPTDDSPGTPVTEKKSLRPLNAFMGFRSWYSKILPDAQQKDVSSFITRLWEKDARRNEWSLIAKLYSSVRDTVGKKNIVLKTFLSHACPIMQIVAPEHYLATFKWSVKMNEAGDRILRQDEAAVQSVLLNMNRNHPATEIELLHAILNDGFMPKFAHVLMEKLAGNANSLMTTSGSKMHELVQNLITDATGTAAQILGVADPVMINTAEVEDFSLLDEALVLSRGEFTQYPASAIGNCMHDGTTAGGEKGALPTMDETDDASSNRSNDSTTSQIVTSPACYNASITISPEFEHTNFQHGAGGTSMDTGAISNMADPGFFPANDNLDYMMSFNEQSMDMGAIQAQHFQSNYDHNGGFSQYF